MMLQSDHVQKKKSPLLSEEDEQYELLGLRELETGMRQIKRSSLFIPFPGERKS